MREQNNLNTFNVFDNRNFVNRSVNNKKLFLFLRNVGRKEIS